MAVKYALRTRKTPWGSYWFARFSELAQGLLSQANKAHMIPRVFDTTEEAEATKKELYEALERKWARKIADEGGGKDPADIAPVNAPKVWEIVEADATDLIEAAGIAVAEQDPIGAMTGAVQT